MHFDEILQNYIGELGLYQIFLLVYCTGLGTFGGINNMDYIFLGAIPEMRCNVSGLEHIEGNLTEDQLRELISPKQQIHEGTATPDSCFMYDRNYSQLSLSDVNRILSQNYTNDRIIECHSWVYSQEQFISTVATEWDMVCDRYWLVSTSQSVFMAGKFFVVLGGWLADRYGRRTMALVMFCVTLFSRVLVSWSPHYLVFVVGRFLLSSSDKIMYAAIFIMDIEMVGPKYRTLAGQTPYVFWVIGYMIVPGMAYFLRDWRLLSWSFLVFYTPYLLLFCVMPESVRWLQSKKKYEQARKQIHIMAKVNGKTAPPDSALYLEEEIEYSVQSKGIMKVVRESAVLIKTTFILWFLWFAANFIYYGIIYYIPKMGGNIYLSTFISGLIGLPSLLAVQLTFDTRLGRKYCTSISYILCGSALLAIIVVPYGNKWLILTLAMAGRFFSTYAYSAIYVYTSELYPTSIRSSCHSLCSTISRFGGVIAPHLILLSSVYTFLPELLFGIISCTAGLLTLLLSETVGTKLPETVTQVLHLDDDSQSKLMHDCSSIGRTKHVKESKESKCNSNM